MCERESEEFRDLGSTEMIERRQRKMVNKREKERKTDIWMRVKDTPHPPTERGRERVRSMIGDSERGRQRERLNISSNLNHEISHTLVESVTTYTHPYTRRYTYIRTHTPIHIHVHRL